MYEDTGYYNHVHMYTASAKEQNARTRTCIFAAYFNELIRVIARKTVTEKTDCRACCGLRSSREEGENALAALLSQQASALVSCVIALAPTHFYSEQIAR